MELQLELDLTLVATAANHQEHSLILDNLTPVN